MFNNIFYLIQYIQNSITSTWNQYSKITNAVFYDLFSIVTF